MATRPTLTELKLERAKALYEFKCRRFQRWGDSWNTRTLRLEALSMAAAKYGVDVNLLKRSLSEEARRQ